MSKPKVGDTFYRYRDIDNGTSIEAYLEEFRVVKLTPKGVRVVPSWFGYWNDEELLKKHSKFINLSSVKKLACQTKEEAWKGFVRRKELQLAYTKKKLEYLEEIRDNIPDKHKEGRYIEIGKTKFEFY